MIRFVIEVNAGPGPDDWKEVGHYYKTRECAKSWLSFVKNVWHTRVRVAKVLIPWVENKPSEV